MPIPSTLKRLQSEFARLCGKIDRKLAQMRFRTSPIDFGYTHVEMSAGEFNYISTERGQEVFHKRTKSEDELLYWLVSDVAWNLACDFELKHRIKGQDFRRLMFAKEIEFLERVKPKWAEAKRQEIEDILKRHPYQDVPED